MLSGVVPWPEDAAHRYRARGYWAGVTIGEAFDASPAAHADRVAVVDGTRRVTYQALGQLVERLAVQLAGRGVCDGERVLFQLPNVLELVVAYLACVKVGAIPVACLPAHRGAEIAYLARFVDAAAWLIPDVFRGFDYVRMADELRGGLPKLREIFVVGDRTARGMTPFADLLEHPIEATVGPTALERLRPSPSAVAVFQLSAGTAGLPKVIPRTHDDYLYSSRALAAAAGFGPDDVLLVSLPAMHNFPLACPGVQGALLLGARVVLAPSSDPDTVFPLIARERVTWVPAVPATLITWTRDPRRRDHDLTSLRHVYVGGARLDPEPARAAIAAFGPIVGQVYGMAEGLLCCTRPDDPEDVIVHTQGRPVSPDDEIRIVDDEDRDVAPGAVGELLTRGPYTLRGYVNATEANRAAFTDDGFYRTGDLVRRHPSGNLVVEGRTKDVINRGGEKVSATEIEDLVLGHPAVLDAAVVPMPDPVLGERACAFVVPRPGASLTLAELSRFLTEERRVAALKLPERLELRDRLPTTTVGKTSKKDLREEIRRLVSEERARSSASGRER